MRIPKRLIQTARSTDLPLLIQAAVANVRLLNPDYEYAFFDDRQVEEFVEGNYPEYVEVFRSFKFRIQRYDFFRYLAVYHFGGFYLDLDVFLASGLSPLLDCGCVFPFEELSVNLYMVRKYGIDWQLGNYAFGAVPGHPFIRAIIANCVRAQVEPAWVEPMMDGIPRAFRDDYYIFNTTSPGLLTRTLAELGDGSLPLTILFPDDVTDRSKWHKFGQYGVHLMEGTWRKGDSALRRRMFWIWWSSMRRRVQRKCRTLGSTRSFEAMPCTS
jgi:hypothetical protein